MKHLHHLTIGLGLVALLASDAIAQAPGANWQVTPGVTGAPSQRRENPGAASATKMYVFGGTSGNSGGSQLNDLWDFDGTTWTQLTANGAAGSPPARTQAAIAFDFSRNKLIVFGGNATSGILNDTWEFDPVTVAWTEITPAAGSPSPRRFHKIAHDPATGSMVTFGGLDASSTHLNDTWVLSAGILWTQLSTSGTPSTRRQHHLVRRPDFGDVILCAGQDVSLSAPAKWRTDVWRFTGSDWVQLSITGTPAAIVANEAAYDPIRKRIVIPGGNGISGGSPTGEVTEFDCVSNEWVVRFGRTTPDPVLGRVSRFFLAFLETTGKIYKISGQVPSTGASPTTTVEYQSDNVATATIGSPGCAGSAGIPSLEATGMMWMGRDLVLEVDNIPTGSTGLLGLGFTTVNVPLSLLGIGSASCILTADPLFVFPMGTNPAGRPHAVPACAGPASGADGSAHADPGLGRDAEHGADVQPPRPQGRRALSSAPLGPARQAWDSDR